MSGIEPVSEPGPGDELVPKYEKKLLSNVEDARESDDDSHISNKYVELPDMHHRYYSSSDLEYYGPPIVVERKRTRSISPSLRSRSHSRERASGSRKSGSENQKHEVIRGRDDIEIPYYYPRPVDERAREREQRLRDLQRGRGREYSDSDLDDYEQNGIVKLDNANLVRFHEDRKRAPEPELDRSLDRTGPKIVIARDHNDYVSRKREYASDSHKSIILPQSFSVGSDDFIRRFSSKIIDAHRRRSDGPVQVTLAFETDCAWFVKEELDGTFDSLWNMVVLTSSEEQHRAMTVGEYVAEMWPASQDAISFVFQQLVSGKVEAPLENTAALTLAYKNRGLIAAGPSENLALSKYSDEVVAQLRAKEPYKELALNSESSVTSVVPAMDGTVISVNWPVRSKFQTLINLSGSNYRLVQLIEALAWLYTTLGYQSNSSDIGLYSDLVREPGVSNLFLLQRGENRDHLPSVGKCWSAVLPHTPCVMSRWFTSSDPDMSGLHLNFELMCFLCGLNYETIYDGGIVLYGEYGMAYPAFAQHNGIQWHFEPCSLDENHHDRLVGSRRLQWDDLEKIRGYENHYLGLWEQAEITLGTAAFDYTTLKYSKAKEVRKETTRDGHSFGGSIALPKAFTLTYTRNYKVARSQKTMFTRSPMENLHSKINTPVILYSPSEERAWMVSYVSVLLHLARSRVHHQKSLGYAIPPCDARGDGGQAAFDCILACHKDPVKQAAEGELLSDAEKSRTIGDYLNDISAAMSEVRRHSNLAKGIFYNKIFGYELNDLARFKEETTLKQQKLDVLANGWGPLLREIKYVFFCEGLADPIVPSVRQLAKHDYSGRCGKSTWTQVPHGHNLLTTSLPCLFDLAERNLEDDDNIWQLIPEYYWHRPSNTAIFEMCDKASTHTCDRLQELASSRSASKPPRLVRDRCENGAVVFKYVESMAEIEYLRQTRDRSRKSGTSQKLITYDWPEARSSSSATPISIGSDAAMDTPSSSTSFKDKSGPVTLREVTDELDPDILHHPDCPCRSCKQKQKPTSRRERRQPPSPSPSPSPSPPPSLSPPPPPRRIKRNKDVEKVSRNTIGGSSREAVEKSSREAESSNRKDSSPKIGSSRRRESSRDRDSSRKTESSERQHTSRRTRTGTHRRHKTESRPKEEEQSTFSRLFSLR